MPPNPEFWFEPACCLIGGDWRAAARTLPVEDPSEGREIARIAAGGPAEIDAVVAAAAAAASGDWGRASAAERGRALAALSRAVAGRAEALARLESPDVGKPLSQARADAHALARYLEFYAGAAEQLMGATIPTRAGYLAFTLREPHGVTGHVIPWNYPMQILGRSVGASLAAGNACVLKPAVEASLTALASRPGYCPRARSTSCPASARRSARRSRRIRACSTSPSPAPSQPAAPSRPRRPPT